QLAFDAWNLIKWPILLVILIIGVSLAYYLFPNVRLPRYRLMTLGSTLSVLVLFGSALALGQLMDHAARFTEVLSVLNGLIGILLLLWIANIVIISGAALDAEFLRARQIASGLHAWHTLQLEPHATHTIDFLADDSAQAERLGRAVAGSVRAGTPLHRERAPWTVDSQPLLPVNPSLRRRRAVAAAPPTHRPHETPSHDRPPDHHRRPPGPRTAHPQGPGDHRGHPHPGRGHVRDQRRRRRRRAGRTPGRIALAPVHLLLPG